MYETHVRFLDGVRFEAESRGHKLICDQPVVNGGADTGMTPPELLLASLATCAGFYAVQYLKARKLPEQGLNVKVTAEKAMSRLVWVRFVSRWTRRPRKTKSIAKACGGRWRSASSTIP